MLKNYSNNDKQIASKLKKILKNKYTPVEDVDDTNLNTNQSSNESDFLALRIIDNLIRFNQSFRLSQVPIKANMGKYKKKGSKEQEDEAKKQEDEAKEQKDLEELLNQFDGDSKFPSSFESLISSYSLIQNIDRNYRDLRPIFNNLSVPVFNDFNDILDETNEIIIKSVKSFNLGKSSHMKKNIYNNINDYRDKFNKIVSTFNNIYNDFKQRKQTFNTNIKTGSGFAYLSKIRNI